MLKRDYSRSAHIGFT